MDYRGNIYRRINMCAQAPRDLKAKSTKIAFKILGKPITMVRDVKPTTRIAKRLVFQETSKVR